MYKLLIYILIFNVFVHTQLYETKGIEEYFNDFCSFGTAKLIHKFNKCFFTYNYDITYILKLKDIISSENPLVIY